MRAIMIAHLIRMRVQLGRSMPFPLCSFRGGGPVYEALFSFLLVVSKGRGRLGQELRRTGPPPGSLLLAFPDSFDRPYIFRLILWLPS